MSSSRHERQTLPEALLRSTRDQYKLATFFRGRGRLTGYLTAVDALWTALRALIGEEPGPLEVRALVAEALKADQTFRAHVRQRHAADSVKSDVWRQVAEAGAGTILYLYLDHLDGAVGQK